MPLFGQFSYDSADPYAVRAQFLTRDTVLTTWCFDRQMLAEGLHRPVGEGDVTFRPQWADGGEFVRVELSDSEGGEERCSSSRRRRSPPSSTRRTPSSRPGTRPSTPTASSRSSWPAGTPDPGPALPQGGMRPPVAAMRAKAAPRTGPLPGPAPPKRPAGGGGRHADVHGWQ
ncbi:hypothetical protein GCM10020254_01240 [Streptomyces goshikiensis]